MIEIPLLFSVLLLTVGGCAVACVLYANQGTAAPLLNRLLLCAGGSLVLWSLGLGLRVSAASRSVAVIGSLIAPVGYATLLGFLLHFILVLTGHDMRFRRKWLYVPLYLPGIMIVFGLSVLPLFGFFPLALHHTSLGWVNNTWNLWVWLYYAYYLLFLIIAAILLLRWARIAGPGKTRKQAVMLLHAILYMAVLGTLTDMLPNALQIEFPGTAVASGILPMLAICLSVRYLDFLQPAKPNMDTVILNQASRAKSIFLMIGSYFLVGSLLNLVSQIILHREDDLRGALLFSAMLLLTGVFIFVMNHIVRTDDTKELALSFILAFFIPFITFRFAQYGSITIWPFIALLLIPGMLFNRRILLITVLSSAFLTQFVLMGAMPDALVRVDGSDYIIRLGLILLAACLCFFVNYTYRHRLRENAMHTMRQTEVSIISRILLRTGLDNFEEKFTLVLAECGKFLRYDRAYVAFMKDGCEPIGTFCEWQDASGSAADKLSAEDRSRLLLALLRQMDGTDSLTLSGDEIADAQPGMAGGIAQSAGIGKLVAVPVLKQKKFTGILCLCSSQASTRSQDSDFIDFLHIVSNMLADTMTKLEALREVQHIAYHDQLTGLPNRLLLKSRLEQSMALADRTCKMIGLVFLDLDSFKSVNDTMGHEIGDRLLVQLASSISGCVRRYDTVARFGGDEFVLILDQISGMADMHRILDKLMAAIRQPVTLQGQEFFMTGSVGVALYPQDGQDVETLIANADLAMYHAKSLGKNRFVLCSQDMKDQIFDQMKMTNMLYRALELDQMIVYYQPQIDLETHEITGLEALLRWKLPDGTMVSPDVFIPIAEKTGLIQPIGRWVLETACRQSRIWQGKGFSPVRMAVNISIQQLRSGSFPEQVLETLQKTGLPPELLELEVTESIASSGSPNISRIFAQLKQMGVSLSIDDFGTQYSSLNRLKVLPVDRLKLDMQFVHGIETSEKDRAITKTIIILAKNLKMKVIAEGVETNSQLDFLSQGLCDEVQGFYYYKPMPAEEVEKHLRRITDG